MSSSRAFWSQQPLRMSSIVIGLTVISSRGYPAAALKRVSGYWRSSINHQSHHVPSSLSAADSYENTPPTNCMFLTLRRSMRGPIALYFAGRRSCHTLGGSMTWSSTEMMRGISTAMVPRLHATRGQSRWLNPYAGYWWDSSAPGDAGRHLTPEDRSHGNFRSGSRAVDCARQREARPARADPRGGGREPEPRG